MANSAFQQRASTALKDKTLRLALDRLTSRFSDLRVSGFASLPDADAVRDRARLIRAHTIAHLDRYLAQFADSVEAAGGHVHWAMTAEDANRIVTQIARAHAVHTIVKGKSMVSEETSLNRALEGAGLTVVESDLGEYILQLAAETPSHIIAPAVHKTREQIGQLFHEKLGIPFTDEPAQLTAAARGKLRDIFLAAEMGISGVNFGVAETGTICIVTNEGNGRLTTSAPRVHVAMMGIERLVPALADLSDMLMVLARSATGQKLTVYTNLITGPRRGGEPDGPDELHVVLVDNGRSRVLGTRLAEILYCIRCGACLNICPVYQQIGGHAYGSVYTGPLGAVLTPALDGIDRWNELPDASSLCGACREVCPVRIDLPRMLVELRNASHRAGKTSLWLRLGLSLYRLAATRPLLFRLAATMARWISRSLAMNGWVTRLPPPLSGWTDHRDFPVFAGRLFSLQLKERTAKARGARRKR